MVSGSRTELQECYPELVVASTLDDNYSPAQLGIHHFLFLVCLVTRLF